MLYRGLFSFQLSFPLAAYFAVTLSVKFYYRQAVIIIRESGKPTADLRGLFGFPQPFFSSAYWIRLKEIKRERVVINSQLGGKVESLEIHK